MLKQVIAGLIALSPFLLDGINEGFSSNLLPQLQSNSFSFRINESELSWIASANVIFMPIGCLFGGLLTEKLGRKKILQLACVLIILGWILILQAESVLIMCIGRCFNGLAVGANVAATMYIVEITDSPKHRAILLSFLNPAIGLGTILSFVLGYILSARNYAIVVCSVALLFLGLISLIPESPVWLTLNNDVSGATKASNWLRKSNDTDDVEHNVTESQNTKSVDPTNDEKVSLTQRIMATKAWKPFLYLTTFFLLEHLTGYAILVYYAANIYELFYVPIDSSVSAIILAVLQFSSWAFLSCVIDKFDRRTLAIVSTGGIFVSYSAVTVYEYLYDTADEKPIFWLPMVCVWSGIVFTSLGLSSLPYIMVGELFPIAVRDFMGSLQLMVAYTIQFVAIKSYPLLVACAKIYGTFFIFSVASFLAILYSLFLLPETRGKTLAEIEKFWLS